MKGLVFKIVCLVAVLIGAYHGKRDHNAKKQANADQIAKIRTDKEERRKELEDAAKPKNEALVVDITDDLNRAKGLFSDADFDETERVLERAIARKPGTEAREKAEAILSELALFRRLTARIPDHPFKDGQQLYRIVLGSGKKVVARVPQTEAKFLELERADGVRLKIRKSSTQSLTVLSPEEHKKEVLTELENRSAELGAEANPVELYRIAVYYCMEFGLKKRAVAFLRKALIQPSGGVLIDLFCEGDTQLDRRTQAKMAGLTDFSQLAMFKPRQPKIPTARPLRPKNPRVRPIDPKPTGPRVKPKPKPAQPQGPKITSEREWIEAEEDYQKGLRVYRDSLRGTAERKNQLIRTARKYFERAQDTLIRLADRYDSSRMLDQRVVEIQQLVYDCIKRQKV